MLVDFTHSYFYSLHVLTYSKSGVLYISERSKKILGHKWIKTGTIWQVVGIHLLLYSWKSWNSIGHNINGLYKYMAIN